MTFEEFDKHQEEITAIINKLSSTKGVEYAHSNERFANFNRLAEDLETSRLTIAYIYAKKHWDSITSYCKENQVYSDESIHGRVYDLILYLMLMDGMITEDEQLGDGGAYEKRKNKGAYEKRKNSL
jgi:hypothetical protein